MLYSEKDIDFSLISDSLFEELCFDLLKRHGFTSLQWRQGGADQGRDIQGEFWPINPLVESYKDIWFFECKNYLGGVSLDKLKTKFAWADANKVDHLVFLMSSYPTNPCRDWLEKMKKQVFYKVHVIEGKQLKDLILQYDELVERYFLNKSQRIFRNTFIDWATVGIFPDPERLNVFYSTINPEVLTREEMAFVLTACIENQIKSTSSFQLNYEDAQRKFFTKIVDILYSLAESSKSDLWRNRKSNFLKIERALLKIKIPLQKSVLRTDSLFITYKSDEVLQKGYYHLIFNEERPVLEMLFMQDVATGMVKTNVYLIQDNQEIPDLLTIFKEEFQKNKSEIESKS